MFVHSLQKALHSLLKPVIFLSPFRHLSEHFFSVALPLVLIGGYTRLPPTTKYNQPWAHWFYSLLSFLSLTRRQFDRLVNILPPVIKQRHVSSKQTNTDRPFATRPFVFLRVLIPQTGFSVVIGALIDTGSAQTVMSTELANLLLTNGAKMRYTWTARLGTFTGVKTVNRALDGRSLLLQSIEDEAVSVQPTPILIEEWSAFHSKRTDMFKVINALNNRGVLPAVTKKWASVMTSKEMNTDGWTAEKSFASGHRHDIILSRDLMDRFVFMHPFQPTYHLTPSLALTRTKIGLTFSGWLDYQTLNSWKVTQEEVKRIESTLYPENNSNQPEPSFEEKAKQSTLSLQTQTKLNKLLTLKLSSTSLIYVDYYYGLISLLLYLHLAVLLLVCLIAGFLFQSLVTISFSRHIPLFRETIICKHSIYFDCLLHLTENMRRLYFGLLTIVLRLLGCSIPSQLMNFSIDPCLPLTVSYESGAGKEKHSKTVIAYLDSGAHKSYINPQLVKELEIKTKKRGATKVKVTVSNPNSTSNDNEHHRIKGIEIQLIQDDRANDFFKEYSNRQKFLSPKMVSRIAHLLSIPLYTPPPSPPFSTTSSTSRFDLLLGTDQLTFLLSPRTHSPRVISLLPSLSAHETRFGYYLQGEQSNDHLTGVTTNWVHHRLYRKTKWQWWLAVCLLVDALLGLLFSKVNFYSF